jgi:protein kinase A
VTSFKDNSYVYLGLEWLPGGDLFSLMNSQKLTELHAQFYAAQMLIALDYLHEVVTNERG